MRIIDKVQSAGQWTLVNEKRNGVDTNGKITGGTVSASAYNLTGKTNTGTICPTIYDDSHSQWRMCRK